MPIGRRLAFLAESNSVTDRVCALNYATGSPLSIAFCNGGLPRESVDAVLLDPPWYLDFMRPMLAAAAHSCRSGEVALISLPPDSGIPYAACDVGGDWNVAQSAACRRASSNRQLTVEIGIPSERAARVTFCNRATLTNIRMLLGSAMTHFAIYGNKFPDLNI